MGMCAGRELSAFRKMENCFINPENVTILFNATQFRATLFEFQMRYPEIRVYIDEDTLYLIPTRKALEKFKKMLCKRKERVEKRYEEITREYNSVKSLWDAVNSYE